MADYGLLVKNNSGGIQIDSKYRNLSLDQSGTSETISNNNTSEGVYTRIALTASSLIPIVLVKPNTDYFVCVRNYYKSGANYAGVDLVTEQSKSTTIDWGSYRENRTASGETYGLKVFNSSGDLCFDSGKNYFKIFSVHSISLSAPSGFLSHLGPYTDITHSGISNPYYLLSPSSFWIMTAPTGRPTPPRGFHRYLLIGMKKLSSTSVRVGWFTFGWLGLGFAPGANSEGNNPAMKLLVCKP